MKRSVLWVPAIALLYLLPSCRHSGAEGLNEHDIKFVKKAREADQAGIKAAQLAISNSKNPRVVAFAKALLDEYTSALLKIKDINTGSPVDSISAAHKQYIDKISKLNGPDFDHAYMNGAVDDTQATMMVYVDAMQGREDSLHIYAETTAHAIQDHADSAKKIAAELK
jgi:putative membrane protein